MVKTEYFELTQGLLKDTDLRGYGGVKPRPKWSVETVFKGYPPVARTRRRESSLRATTLRALRKRRDDLTGAPPKESSLLLASGRLT